jgi:hypothetical protein
MLKEQFQQHLQALAAAQTSVPAIMIYARGTFATIFYQGKQAGMLATVESDDTEQVHQRTGTACLARVESTPGVIEYFVGEQAHDRMQSVVDANRSSRVGMSPLEAKESQGRIEPPLVAKANA